MKQTIRGPSCVETSTVAPGKNVSWCCNIPANTTARAAADARGRPNNQGNPARKRGVGFDCDRRVAVNEWRFQAVGKKQNAGITRLDTPLWCRFSGDRHEDRACFFPHEIGARDV
jgi:hypothetical protein